MTPNHYSECSDCKAPLVDGRVYPLGWPERGLCRDCCQRINPRLVESRDAQYDAGNMSIVALAATLFGEASRPVPAMIPVPVADGRLPRPRSSGTTVRDYCALHRVIAELLD